MQIAVVSDTHSRYATVEAALGLIRERGIDLVIHCGDIEDPATVELFGDFTTHFVFGNCDTYRADLETAMKAVGATCHGSFGVLELAGRKVGWTHGDDQRLLHDLETSGAFDFLFYGHTHVAEQHRTGPTLVVNPGALHRARPKTFVLLDPASGEVVSLEVGP
jgi:uncharacterized protein